MVFSAKKRNRTFPARPRPRRGGTNAVQPKPAPEPTPSNPNPQPPTPAPAAVPYDDSPADPEVSTAPDVSSYGTENASGGAESDFPEDEQPLGDLREVADRAAQATQKEQPLTNPAVADALRLPREWVTGEPEVRPDERPAAQAKRSRGRPRSLETIARDKRVYALLLDSGTEGVAKEAIAAELGEKQQQVYSSLRRLSGEGRAHTTYVKGHGYRWFASDQ